MWAGRGKISNKKKGPPKMTAPFILAKKKKKGAEKGTPFYEGILEEVNDVRGA